MWENIYSRKTGELSLFKFNNKHASCLGLGLTLSEVSHASHSVCTTVACVTCSWAKFVDEVGSTVFYKNISCVFATSRAITKADRLFNFIIFHRRMSTIQPAWPVCTTSECWHTRCWHFCPCSSLKTIPSLKELFVTPHLFLGCYVTTLSTAIIQALMIITWVGWKRLNRNSKNVKESKVNIFPWHLLQNQLNKKQTAFAFFEKKKKNYGDPCHTTLKSKVLLIFLLASLKFSKW